MAAAHYWESAQKDRTKYHALKAIEYASGRFQILSRALDLLVKTGGPKEAEDIYFKIVAEEPTLENRIFDLRLK